MPDNVSDKSGRTEQLAAALRSILRAGASLGVGQDVGCTIMGVTARERDVLVTFRWMSYPLVLGLGIGPDSEYRNVQEPDDWAVDAVTWLQEELGTGLIVGASRHQHDDIIELGARDWPNDQRFYPSSAGPDDEYAWDSIHYFERDGFDTTIVRGLRADNTLISWERAYLNNRIGAPFVGHAAVARIDSDTARLVYCDLSPEVPETVALQLCLSATHEASWHGALRVITDLDNPIFDIVGFQHVDGERQLTTDFLHVDHEAAARLLSETSQWRASTSSHDRASVHRVQIVADPRLKG